MRLTFFGLAILLYGCAGQPSAQHAATSEAPLANPELLSQARKMGYLLVNEDGQELYCRSDLQTGSHVERETVCLTAADIDRLRDQTHRSLKNVLTQVPPPVGH